MLYSGCKFHKQIIDMNDYILKSSQKEANKFRYTVISKNNKNLLILLRWKNGNGIAHTAFQIS